MLSSQPMAAQTTLRELLLNGATVYAVQMPAAKSFSIQLFAGPRPGRDKPETYGWRHLLEHLVAKGLDGQLDVRLESAGLFLSAGTQRDIVRFAIDGPADGFEKAAAELPALLAPPKPSPDDIQREAAIIRNELALSTPTTLTVRDAWRRTFKEGGLDPLGDFSAGTRPAPEALANLWKGLFQPGNLVLVAAGPAPVERMLSRMRPVLAGLKDLPTAAKQSAAPTLPKPFRTLGEGGREVLAIPVPGLGEKQALARLAASLAVAARWQDSEIVYTPSAAPSLIVITGFRDGEPPLGSEGRRLVQSWIEGSQQNPSQVAALRGAWAAQDRSLTPERVLELLRYLKDSDIERAIREIWELQ